MNHQARLASPVYGRRLILLLLLVAMLLPLTRSPSTACATGS